MGILGERSTVSGPLTPDILKKASATQKHVLVHWQEGKTNLGRFRLKFISWIASRPSQDIDKKVAINYCTLGSFILSARAEHPTLHGKLGPHTLYVTMGSLQPIPGEPEACLSLPKAAM